MTVLMMFHYSSFAQDTDPFSYNANIRPSDQPIFRYAGSVLDVVFSPSLVSITNKSLRPLETIENKAGTIASYISFILQTINNTDTTNIESNDSNINEIDVDNHIK